MSTTNSAIIGVLPSKTDFTPSSFVVLSEKIAANKSSEQDSCKD
jgi:hypothetical protein